MRRFADAMAARTRFFDDFFIGATDAGIRQAVILAAGLDARAYRLSWPDGTVVFEIDQPEVIDFKARTMAELGARPTAQLRTVAVDLRADWPAALIGAGFDARRPTAWIAEDCSAISPAGQDRLLDQITALSVPGSRMAAEGVPSQQGADEEASRERMQASADRWREHGFDIDFAALVFLGDRADPAAYLAGHGWSTTAVKANDLLVRYGLAPLGSDEGFADVSYVSAEK